MKPRNVSLPVLDSAPRERRRRLRPNADHTTRSLFSIALRASDVDGCQRRSRDALALRSSDVGGCRRRSRDALAARERLDSAALKRRWCEDPNVRAEREAIEVRSIAIARCALE
ncbi:MAG: hypothetical protein DIU78_018775 [Pseudomonadota bacterium]